MRRPSNAGAMDLHQAALEFCTDQQREQQQQQHQQQEEEAPPVAPAAAPVAPAGHCVIASTGFAVPADYRRACANAADSMVYVFQWPCSDPRQHLCRVVGTQTAETKALYPNQIVPSGSR